MPENFSAAYYAHFESREGKIGVIFTSDQLVAPLNNPDTEDLFINGTFDSRPTEPKSCQLLIINIKRRDAEIPVIFVLCENHTKDFYAALWTFVFATAPNLR